MDPLRSYGRTAVVLGVALALLIAAWVQSELHRGRLVGDLQARIAELEGRLVERDRALVAHEQRLHDIRDRLGSLQELVDGALPHPR